MFITYIIAIAFFILLNGFFAGSEAALTTVNKIRLRHLVESNDGRAIMVNEFLKKEGLFLGTTLVGTNICAVTGTALATSLLSNYFGANAALISTVLMTAFILIFGEIVPKTIYRRASDTISLKVIKPLRLSSLLLYPLIFVVTHIANFFLTPFLKRPLRKATTPFVTKADLKIILRTSKEKGGVEADEEKLIYRIFDFGAKTADKIMIPLYKITSININESLDSIKRLVNENKFSRIPVYENEKNNIVGIINIYDILFTEEEKPELKDYIRSPYFIDDTEGIDRILSNLRKKKRAMAIVTNRDGKSAGIVTMEDILEEIVGEIGG